MNSFWDWLLWYVHHLGGPGKRSIPYYQARQRHLDWRQAAEAYRLTRGFSTAETVGFFDSVTPGSIENAMRMLRAVREPAYLTSFVIDCRYAGSERDRDARMRSASPLFGDGRNTRSLGYQDVIMLSEAGVTPTEARALMSCMSVSKAIACVQEGIPTDYAVQASRAGHQPSEAWANGLSIEYLV